MIHAARYIQLTKQPGMIAQVSAGDTTGLPAREQAIIGFAARLAGRARAPGGLTSRRMTCRRMTCRRMTGIVTLRG